MKISIVIFLTFVFSTNLISQLEIENGLKQLNVNDVCQITQASHDSWIDWTTNDDYIVYISPESGKNNLYRIKVDDLPLTELKSGFYGASYLLDTLAKHPTEQLTFETKRIVESPVVLPNSNKVAFKTYFCNDSYECLDFDLRVYDFDTKKTTIIYKDKVYLYNFINSENLLFVSHDNDSSIKELNLKTGVTSDFMSFDFSVTALQVHGDEVLINSSYGIYSIDLQKKELVNIYKGKIFGTRLAIVDQNLIATLPGPASGFINLKTNEETKYFNTYDYEPSVSNSNIFVAVISEGASGILIKRIK